MLPNPQVTTDPDACPICGASPAAYTHDDAVIRRCANGDTWHYDPGTGAKTVDSSVVAALSIISISPTSGPAAGGTLVTLTGTGFVDPMYTSVGGALTEMVIVNSTTIQGKTPAYDPGVVAVHVSHNSGFSPEQVLAAAYTFT